MTLLPPIYNLIRRTKSLAALDLILSPEWEYRYYSFNMRWASCEQMASMRNGCGDEWWLLFHENGWAALKGLDHESKAWSKGREHLAKALCSVIPTELSSFSQEPAFRWSATSFAFFCLSDVDGWRRANDLTEFADIGDTGEDSLLHHLTGNAEDYASFAEEYFEKSIPVEIVSSILDFQPMTNQWVTHLNPEISLEDISHELAEEIGYPVAETMPS